MIISMTYDRDLLERISLKEKEAYIALYEKYHKLIYGFVLKTIKDQKTAEDIVQDFWLRVWEDVSFLKCDEAGSVRAYALQHLRFRVSDKFRQNLSKEVEIDIEEAENLLGCYEHVSEGLECQELYEKVNEALRRKSISTRSVFWMRVNNIPIEEVAHKLKITKRTVYNRYNECMNTVRSFLRSDAPEFLEQIKNKPT